MKPTTELVKYELAFSQQSLFTPEEFLDEYRRRDLHSDSTSRSQLETLHREQVLVPWYRIAKKMQGLLSAYKPDSPSLMPEVALGTANILDHYWNGLDVATLHDPRREVYRPWRRYRRKLEHGTVWTSDFLYSPYQLLMAPMIHSLFRRLRWRKIVDLDYSYTLRLNDIEKADLQKRCSENDKLVFLLTVLDTKYRPLVTNRITNHRQGGIEAWNNYNRDLNPVTLLESLEWDVKEILKEAERLLRTADSFDPLSEWYQLVRLCRSDKWTKLRGDALLALDYRIAAEILLCFYDDLVEAGAAPPLEPLPKRFPGPRRKRLGTSGRELNSVLMDFGISPQPSLILVLEGATEMRLVPRVMELLGADLQSVRIKLFDAQGVTRDFGVLARYAATPEIGEEVGIGKGFLLTRPPTHFLVAIDPEHAFDTPEKVEEKRKAWVEDIWRALPKRYGGKISKTEIDRLVEVKTWNNAGQSFEFAHFTDYQIAKGILRTYRGPSAPPLQELVKRVASIRARAGNLKILWKDWEGNQPSKPRIAETLWPVLKRRILRAMNNNTQDKIPVVRVVLHAINRAYRLHRHSVMIRSL